MHVVQSFRRAGDARAGDVLVVRRNVVCNVMVDNRTARREVLDHHGVQVGRSACSERRLPSHHRPLPLIQAHLLRPSPASLHSSEAFYGICRTEFLLTEKMLRSLQRLRTQLTASQIVLTIAENRKISQSLYRLTRSGSMYTMRNNRSFFNRC